MNDQRAASLASPNPTAPIVRAGADLALSDVATTQHGLFTRDQAETCGVGLRTLQRRKAAGLLREVQPGVYAPAQQPPSFVSDCLAAVLSLPIAAASGRAAALLHGFGGFRSAPIEVLVPRGGATRRQGVVLHRIARWLPEHVVDVRGVPTTSLPLTVLHLARSLDRRRIEHALDDALRLGLDQAVLSQLLVELDPRRAGGSVVLRELLDHPSRSCVVPDSWFERLVEYALTCDDLPPSVRHHRVIVQGRFVARVDVAYPIVCVAVEAQSRRYHASSKAQREDRRRFGRLRDAGWEVVEWWWEDLADPMEAVALVRAACRRQAERYRISPYTWQSVSLAG